MYIPQKLKSLLIFAGIIAAAFAAYQVPAVRALINGTAAKHGIVLDDNSPEAQILRLKGSYDDRTPEQIRKEEIDRKLKKFRSTDVQPNGAASDAGTRVYRSGSSYSDEPEMQHRHHGKRR